MLGTNVGMSLEQDHICVDISSYGDATMKKLVSPLEGSLTRCFRCSLENYRTERLTYFGATCGLPPYSSQSVLLDFIFCKKISKELLPLWSY